MVMDKLWKSKINGKMGFLMCTGQTKSTAKTYGQNWSGVTSGTGKEMELAWIHFAAKK